jgi:hypothetical protein
LPVKTLSDGKTGILPVKILSEGETGILSVKTIKNRINSACLTCSTGKSNADATYSMLNPIFHLIFSFFGLKLKEIKPR